MGQAGLVFESTHFALQFSPKVEQAAPSLVPLLGTQQQSTAFLTELLTETRRRSSLQSDVWIDGSQRLLQTKMPANIVTKNINGIAMGSTGLKMDARAVGDLIDLYAHMYSGVVLSDFDVTTLNGLGLPVINILADAYKVSLPEMRGHIIRGEILAGDALQVLSNWMDKTYEGVAYACGA
jgi:hypothetical protein